MPPLLLIAVVAVEADELFAFFIKKGHASLMSVALESNDSFLFNYLLILWLIAVIRPYHLPDHFENLSIKLRLHLTLVARVL